MSDYSKIIDAYPLSQMQEGMYYHCELEPQSDIYHDVFSLHIQSPWSETEFVTAGERLVARHPILRASFDFRQFSRPMQLIHAEGVIRFRYICLDPDDDADRQISREIALLQASRFDLSQPTLIRFTVLRRGRDDFQLLGDAHHMILDGWSMASLLTELFQRYLQNLRLLPETPYPPLRSSHKAFVKEEMNTAQGAEAKIYWQQQLSSMQYHSLSTDGGSLPVAPAPREIAEVEQAIDVDTSNKLAVLAKRLGVGLPTVLLAIHARVMALAMNRATIISTVTVNGRLEQSRSWR